MKKVSLLITFSLAFVLFATNSVVAQNLMLNGDLETWSDPNTPSDWDKAENVTQNSTVVYAGTYSAEQQAGTSDLQQNVTGIVGGDSYTITYHYLDNDANARSRIWSYWTSGGSTLSENATELRVSTYSSDDPAWQEYTVSIDAPASADGFRFEVRTYNDNAGGGIVYYDDFSVIATGTPPPPSTVELYYEPFDTDLGATTQYDAFGAEEWYWDSYGSPPGCAVMSGYSGGPQDNEDWLITNSFDCSGYINVTLSFDHARNYADNTGLSVLISTDYDGSGDPNSFSWTDLTSSFTFPASGSWSFIEAGTVDINAYVGSSTYVAFKYESTTSADAPQWEVDNITVEAELDPSNIPHIAGSFQGWDPSDPDYAMALNANGLYELTKSLGAGTWEYKAVEGDNWSAPNYPGVNQVFTLAATEDVTWKVNTDAELVTHTIPVVAGDFLSAIGGTNWEPTELMGEMSDPEGDDVYTLELVIPAGNYEAKVTLNHNWDQSTGGNVLFEADGVNATIFTYDFPTNTTTISGPPPDTAVVTFLVKDTVNMMYDGFYLKGSWDANGQYDPSWGNGMDHGQFYDDGTNGDAIAGDHIWTCLQNLVVDEGSNTWEWGVNDSENFWITGNWQFTLPDDSPQTLVWVVPDVVDLVINEIMYNSIGADEEWIELYNNTDTEINLEGFRICDNDESHTNIVIPAGYSIPADGFFTVSISTDGAFPFTPDYDGTGNFGLNNGGDAVRIWNADNILNDIVDYSDSSPWPTEPDGDGPSLSLISPDLDNSLAESWKASNQEGGTPGAWNFPIVVTAPNGGEVIETGSVFDITWTTDQYSGDIRIELVQEDQDPQLIVSNLPSDNGTFAWTVLEGTTPASDYRIRITDMSDDDIFDESDNVFSITQGIISYDIVITEIMYNPPETDTDSLEFLELYNNGAETVNLEGFTFTDGIEYTFPNVDMAPEEYILVAVNSDAMFSTFGVTAYQWTGGALSNGGEKIQLNDNGGNVVDSLTYSDDLPWDTLCDGYGPSLTLCNPDVDNSVAENWTHSEHIAAFNASGDTIFATPGTSCMVSLLADFVGEPTTVQAGESVMFTDNSIGDIIEWNWTFEGGDPATYSGQNPPEIFYNEVGTYDVSLEVTDGTNIDELVYLDYIEVVDFPAPTNLQAEVGSLDDVQLTWTAPGPSDFTDDFESYEDFSIDFTPWVNLDVDGSTTYGMTDITWLHAYEAQSFIIFNPSQTTPAVEDIVPHSGDKLAACFAATSPPNNDWMITPMINIQSGFNASFFAKSYTDTYGLERFRVGVSTTGLNPEDFTIISDGDYVEAPVDDWTEFSFSLEDYVGQSVYVGIQCVSNDAFILLVDDFSVAASKATASYNSNTAVVGRADRNVSYTAVPNPITVAQQIQSVRTEDPLGYNVYRDEVMINTTIVEETQYNDHHPEIGTHDYYVTAVYDGGESAPSNTVTVVITDINENEAGVVDIYPNPASDMLTVQITDGLDIDIAVMDLTGKIVYTDNIKESTQFDVSSYNSGVYFVRILDKTTGNVSAHKLIIR